MDAIKQAMASLDEAISEVEAQLDPLRKARALLAGDQAAKDQAPPKPRPRTKTTEAVAGAVKTTHAERAKPRTRPQSECEEWLREILSVSPGQKAGDILQAGEDQGFGRSTTYRAADALEVERRKDGTARRWHLPTPDPERREVPADELHDLVEDGEPLSKDELDRQIAEMEDEPPEHPVRVGRPAEGLSDHNEDFAHVGDILNGDDGAHPLDD